MISKKKYSKALEIIEKYREQEMDIYLSKINNGNKILSPQTKIKDCLPTRTKNCLYASVFGHIRYPQNQEIKLLDLADFSISDLRGLRGIGVTGLRAIRKACLSAGIILKDKIIIE